MIMTLPQSPFEVLTPEQQYVLSRALCRWIAANAPTLVAILRAEMLQENVVVNTPDLHRFLRCAYEYMCDTMGIDAVYALSA